MKTPVEIEAVDLVPVALPERIRESAINGPGGVNADQVEAIGARGDLLGHGFGWRQHAAAFVRRRIGCFGDQKPRVLRQLRQGITQARERAADEREVFLRAGDRKGR
ncbi:hypothetical protein D3C83_17830 [compost metagenome]